MSDRAPDEPFDLEERLAPDVLPRLAYFLGAWLHEDLALEHGSAAAAAWAYAEEAELDELEELAADWEELRAAARKLPLARVNALLRDHFGSSWQAVSAAEIDAVGAELHRALAE
jgi:hypothetical protein